MVTNYPRSIASRERLGTTSRPAQGDGFHRVMDWLRQAFCGLYGHDTMLNFEPRRMSLRCVSCGHQTPGWVLNEVPPTVTVHADARRLAIARPQPISTRRIA